MNPTPHSSPAPRTAGTSRVAQILREDARLARWAAGSGVVRHTPATITRIHDLARRLPDAGAEGSLFDVLEALDRLTNAGMWLVVHETYARRVRLDGAPLAREDFKPKPEGHTGGALNMVPAYAGYLAANAVTSVTRSWLMGQGHTVAAIDSLNLLVGNTTPAHAARYAVDDAGLSRYVSDFYSYRIGDDGRQESPLGSHVNVHTAGGLAEGGYLGFAELQYVHMPLPGERLVVFLSDGAFEEQRGSDWAARWWRAEDSGLVVPIMIANGRRIDQRTTMSQQGGVSWFRRHLKLNGFDPIVFDGKDPAAYVWAILEMERLLEERGAEARRTGKYPVQLPYGIAVTVKGHGFPGAGTNASHNLPLGANPSVDGKAASRFRSGAKRLFVPETELRPALAAFARHDASGRPRERDHALATRRPAYTVPPAQEARPVPADRGDRNAWTRGCPMDAVDRGFQAWVRANPGLRPRVGNPDELRSNRMGGTLDLLRHRVTDPEKGVAESVHGAVITALNEEAVAAAAIGNESGLNLVVSYEAFAAKMHGLLRQEIIFTQHAIAAGQSPGWLSMPLVLTSHLWENGKNEQSHQDPSLCEALLCEASHVSRVLFPADTNGAAAVIHAVFQSRAQTWTLVVPKQSHVADLFDGTEARTLLERGGARLPFLGHEPSRARLVLTAIGAYQLEEVARASLRLAERGVAHAVNYLLEPGRFRAPRDRFEEAHLARGATRDELFPAESDLRIFVVHGHPEPFLGTLSPVHTGARTRGLGYRNQGGTLDVAGLLFVNGCTWAHVVDAAAQLLGVDRATLLAADELDALDGRRSPQGILIPSPHAPAR